MMKSKLLLALIACTSICLPVSAKTFKWVDDQGVTHYGSTIPPEYANKDRQTLSKSGTVIKNQDVLTPEEQRAKEEESARKRADEAATRDQKRHDKSLTNTYSSVEEIELSRTRNIQQVEARINSVNSQLKMAKKSLEDLQKDAAARSKAGNKIPASLQDDIDETKDRVNRLQSDLDKYQAEKMAVEKRFEEDKVRYKELTGK